MPGSRRGSGNHGDLPGINLQGLSIRDSNTPSQSGQTGILKNGAGGVFGPTASQSKTFNPGFLLDEELDKEVSRDMHSKRNLYSDPEPTLTCYRIRQLSPPFIRGGTQVAAQVRFVLQALRL
jgi:hypothetical protein